MLGEGSRPEARLVVVDEAWTLLRDGEGAKFLYRLSKSARKRRAGLAVITQDVGDLLGSDLGQAVIANAATQVLLRQAPQAVDQVVDAFGLTAGEARMLLAARSCSPVAARRVGEPAPRLGSVVWAQPAVVGDRWLGAHVATVAAVQDEVAAARAGPPVADGPGRRAAGVAVPVATQVWLVADQLAYLPVGEGDYVPVGAGPVDQAAQLGGGVDDALDDGHAGGRGCRPGPSGS